MNIYGEIFSAEIINKIQAMIKSQPNISRRKLSQKVCQWFDWRDSNGKWKEMSCRVAMLKLHRAGHISLPAGGQNPQRQSKKEEITEEIPTIICDLSELGCVELIKVTGSDKKSSRLWNNLMSHYHYLGAGPLCGAQIRQAVTE